MKYLLEDTYKTDDLNFVEISISGSLASRQILNCEKEFTYNLQLFNPNPLDHKAKL